MFVLVMELNAWAKVVSSHTMFGPSGLSMWSYRSLKSPSKICSTPGPPKSVVFMAFLIAVVPVLKSLAPLNRGP